jgi:hypothetical protein
MQLQRDLERTATFRAAADTALAVIVTHKKTGRSARFFITQKRENRLRSLDVARLLFAFVAGSHFEGHFLSFGERFESGHVDAGEVRKKIFAAFIGSDEAETFCIVEPFNSTGSHCVVPNK